MKWIVLWQALLCAASGQAFAAEPLQLSFSAPPDCGSATTISQRLNATLPLAKRRGWRASVDITRVDEEHLLLRVRTDGPESTSTRDLTVDTCPGAIRAAALLIILAIDPMLVDTEEQDAALTETQRADSLASEAPTQRDVGVDEPLVRETDEARPPIPSPKHQPTRPLRIGVMGAGLGHWGETAAVAVGATLGVRGQYGPLWMAVSGSWLVNRETTLEGAPGGVLETSGLGAHVDLGWLLGDGVVQFGPLAGVGIRRVQARASGISEPNQGQSSYWTHLRAGAQLNLNTPTFLEVFSNISAVVPIRRPIYEVQGLGEVHRAEPLGLDLQIGVFWQLPPQ